MRALLLLLAACGAPHLPPAPRSVALQAASVIWLHIECSSQTPIDSMDWAPARGATGVLISGRYALTAAHAVWCPTIPEARALLANGSRARVGVERDDEIFPHAAEPSDIARLELVTGGEFDIAIAPPLLGLAHGECCAETVRGGECGQVDPYQRGVLRGVWLRAGDSGAPLYCERKLAGIIVGRDGDAATFVPIDPYWLEGT